jgi:hypothetical protein
MYTDVEYYQTIKENGRIYEIWSTRPIVNEEVQIGSENILFFQESGRIRTLYFDDTECYEGDTFDSFDEMMEDYQNGVYSVRMDDLGYIWVAFT